MTSVITSTPILEARGLTDLGSAGLTRSFGAVRALDDADFDVHAGEVVALIGDNGARQVDYGQSDVRQSPPAHQGQHRR